MKEAAPLSLIIILGVSSISTLNHYREHRIKVKTGLYLEGFILVGAVGGTYVNMFLSEETLRVWFALVLLLLGGWTFFGILRASGSSSQPEGRNSITNLSMYRKIAVFALAFLSGTIAGSLGIGGGVVMIPILVYTVGMPMTVAAGTSSLMIAITALGSGIIYYARGQLLSVEHVFTFLLAGASGAYLSTRFSMRRLGSQLLSVIFASVLVLVGLFMLIEANLFHPT